MSKIGMKGTGHKKPLRKVSPKQAKELKERVRLKAELLEECDHTCMTCGNVNLDWRGWSLSHIIPLSRGGKTNRENCLIECYPDHEKYEKKPELRIRTLIYRGMPNNKGQSRGKKCK